MEQKFYNDGITIISITTIILGCLVMSLKILFKSKCKDIDICYGLLKIKRTVELENDIEIDNIPKQISMSLHLLLNKIFKDITRQPKIIVVILIIVTP